MSSRMAEPGVQPSNNPVTLARYFWWWSDRASVRLQASRGDLMCSQPTTGNQEVPLQGKNRSEGSKGSEGRGGAKLSVPMGGVSQATDATACRQ